MRLKQAAATHGYCGSGHAEPRNAARGPPERWALLFGGRGDMRLLGAHWLDYDSVAVAVLAAGIGIVLLGALSI